MIVNVTEIIQSVTVEEIINDIDITIEESVSTIIVQQSGTQGAAGANGATDHNLLSNIGVNSHVNIDSHIASTSNPHGVTKSQVGLGNVDNTSDANKAVSTATQTALDLKVDENAAIVGATNTKITYDAKGLVVSGTSATTTDIIDGTNKRYVTDQNLTDLNNTSGTNTGDQDLSGYLLKTTPSPTPVVITADEFAFVASTGLMEFTGYGDVSFSSLGEYNIESDNDITLQSIGKTVIKNINGNDALVAFAVKNTALSEVLTIDGIGNVVADGEITGSNLSGTNTGDQSRESLGISMTSLYSGGEVTGFGTATFSVAAGLGYIVSQTLIQLEPNSVAVNFNAVTSVAPLYTRGVIYVNSAGTILQVDVGGTPLTQLFKKQNIILASYLVSGGVIISLPSLRSTSIGTPSKLEDLMEALGPLNLSGNIYSANNANLFLNKSAGETFQLKSNITNSLDVRDITIDAAGAPIANATTAYGYRNGSGGFTLVAYTGVTPNLWDDGSGTPASVTGGRFTIQRLYYFNRSNSTIIYLGQTEYTTLAIADAAVGTEIRVVDSATTFGTFRSSLVVKHNTTDLTDSSKAVFFEASKFGASGAGSSSGTTTLQGAYNNSTNPEITTNSTLGSLTVQRGSAADTDFILEGKNGAGTTTFSVTGEGTVKGKNVPNLTPTALSISFTGAWLYNFPYILVPSNNTDTDGVVETYSGKWIEKFDYTEVVSAPSLKILTLTFNDLEGVSGNISPSNMASLTSMSFPALKVVGGNFTPATFAINSTLSVPELRLVLGSFSPTAMSNLATLSAPNLRCVGGSISPSVGIIATMNFPELVSIGLNLQPNLLTSLVTLTFPKLKYIGGSMSPSTVGSILTLSFPLLESVGAGFNATGIASLTTVSVPLLARVVGAFTVSGTLVSSVTTTSLISCSANLTHTAGAQTGTISYPALTTVTGSCAVTGCTIATSLSMPLLTNIGSGSFSTSGNITSVNLNSLTTCLGSLTISYAKLTSFTPTVLNNISTNLTLTGCNLLTTLNLLAMATYGGTITVTTIPVLTTVRIGVIGTLKRITGATVSFSGCALNQTSVDAILAVLVSLDGTNATTLFGSGKTVTLSGGTNSTPSTAGLANKAILVGRGATVTNN